MDFHDLAGSAALLPGAVVVGIARNASRFAGRKEGVVDRARAAQIGDVERPADAAPFVFADALVVFGPLEIRQDARVVPAGIAERGPMIIVRALAAGIDHRVDRRAPADHAAARLKPASAVELRLRHGLIAHRVQPDGRGGGKAQRRMNKHALVGPSRFEKADADAGVFRQTPRQCASARPCADDNVVELHRAHPVFPPLFLVGGDCRAVSFLTNQCVRCQFGRMSLCARQLAWRWMPAP